MGLSNTTPALCSYRNFFELSTMKGWFKSLLAVHRSRGSLIKHLIKKSLAFSEISSGISGKSSSIAICSNRSFKPWTDQYGDLPEHLHQNTAEGPYVQRCLVLTHQYGFWRTIKWSSIINNNGQYRESSQDWTREIHHPQSSRVTHPWQLSSTDDTQRKRRNQVHDFTRKLALLRKSYLPL